jgi:acetate kinase
MNSNDIILILNAGASSIKFSLFPASTTDLLCDGELSGIGHAIHFRAVNGQHETIEDKQFPEGIDHETAITILLNWVKLHYENQHILAAGHRVVHGGNRYIAPTVITDEVLAELRRLIPLAPLHQPHHIAAIVALQKRYPDLIQVACFDTAFHHTNAQVATNFAIPRALTEEGIRRYGFHGLSYEYIADTMQSIMGQELANSRVIVAHLGAGASMCAMKNRQSVATTMGFTALDGLPMSRRCGNIDPGLVLYLMQEKKMSADNLAHFLYNDCGLLGVSGVSDDMQTLLASADPHALDAIDLFVYRIGREIGSLAAALGGLDVLIFTAGIGEHAAKIRYKISIHSAWLGVTIDEQRNNSKANNHGGFCISPNGAKVSTWVIPTNEDLMIARHTQHLLFPS